MKILTTHVISGSAGIWGDVPMPPNPELSPQKALSTVEFMIKQGSRKNSCVYPGTEGAFQTIDKPARNWKGVHVLTASYTDHGINDDELIRKRVQHSIVLKANR